MEQKNSLEEGLNRVLFATEIEFSMKLRPRLPQNTSNLNTECPGKPEQQY